jgi:hypothetical protein
LGKRKRLAGQQQRYRSADPANGFSARQIALLSLQPHSRRRIARFRMLGIEEGGTVKGRLRAHRPVKVPTMP